MRPLNQREINEERAVNAWKIYANSITLDQQLFNTNQNQRFIVPSGAYSTLLAPCPAPNQSKAYSFSIIILYLILFCFQMVVLPQSIRTQISTIKAACELWYLVLWKASMERCSCTGRQELARHSQCSAKTTTMIQ